MKLSIPSYNPETGEYEEVTLETEREVVEEEEGVGGGERTTGLQ